jgi:hypothetical protein
MSVVPAISFDPPVCVQRYLRVCRTLEKIIHEAGAEDPSLKTVMEVGCAELRLHRYIRHASYSVRKIIYLDKDEELLETVNISTIP